MGFGPFASPFGWGFYPFGWGGFYPYWGGYYGHPIFHRGGFDHGIHRGQVGGALHGHPGAIRAGGFGASHGFEGGFHNGGGFGGFLGGGAHL